MRAGILQPSSVLAVTFTNRAAGEMRGRLRDRLHCLRAPLGDRHEPQVP
ncbi:UvrD-helicase domain-containing protein [Streptomyces sp. NPDC005386]